ncbi:MAG: cell division protein FtsL [Treponema sp.]|nr:cell division protein FtsL [Treponema sp.]
MKRHFLLLYFFIITIPIFLGVIAFQSVRYHKLDKDLKRLEAVQEDWVESNKKLIAGIAVLSSSGRIERIAKNDLKLSKILPEDVLQVRIEGEERP